MIHAPAAAAERRPHPLLHNPGCETSANAIPDATLPQGGYEEPRGTSLACSCSCSARSRVSSAKAGRSCSKKVDDGLPYHTVPKVDVLEAPSSPKSLESQKQIPPVHTDLKEFSDCIGFGMGGSQSARAVGSYQHIGCRRSECVNLRAAETGGQG